jgi:hypothetical protein
MHVNFWCCCLHFLVRLFQTGILPILAVLGDELFPHEMMLSQCFLIGGGMLCVELHTRQCNPSVVHQEFGKGSDP